MGVACGDDILVGHSLAVEPLHLRPAAGVGLARPHHRTAASTRHEWMRRGTIVWRQLKIDLRSRARVPAVEHDVRAHSEGGRGGAVGVGMHQHRGALAAAVVLA